MKGAPGPRRAHGAPAAPGCKLAQGQSLSGQRGRCSLQRSRAWNRRDRRKGTVSTLGAERDSMLRAMGARLLLREKVGMWRKKIWVKPVVVGWRWRYH